MSDPVLYLFAFAVVGCAAGASALMKRAGYGERPMEATLAGAIVGLVILFAVPSVPVLAMAVALLLSMGACVLFHRKR